MRIRLIVVALVAGVAVIGSAGATPSIGVTADTARGELTTNLNLRREFSNGGAVMLKTRGPVELIVQRIEAVPGATFGWHTHPGETLVVVKQGTLTLYRDKHCTAGTDYGPGTTFAQSPEEIHLAKNLSTTETLIVFAVYFAPKTTPDTPVRVDQPSPGHECPL